MRGILTGLALVLIVLPAWAQVSDTEWERCEGAKVSRVTIEALIDGCTQLIKSGRLATAQRAAAYVIRGNHYYAKTLYDEAISDYTQAVTLRPDFADAYYRRGAAYSVENRSALALADYNKAIALKPDFTDAYISLGNYFSAIGLVDQSIAEYSQAITNYTKALSLNPKLPIMIAVYWSRARAYERMGERDKAISDYRMAFKLAPGDQLFESELKRLGIAP